MKYENTLAILEKNKNYKSGEKPFPLELIPEKDSAPQHA
jgi:hypothetical protein